MVSYNVGGSDPEVLPIGTYYIRVRAPTRGKNAGRVFHETFQVRKRSGPRSESKYWSKVKNTRPGGMPEPMSARRLGIEPTQEAIRAFEGNKVYLRTAFDQNGENPSSVFVLKRRKDGDGHHYYWSMLEGDVPAAKRRSPSTRKVSKPRGRRNVTRSLAGAVSENE